MSNIPFHAATPIFPIRDLKASIAYYTDILGFTVEWNHENIAASVFRGEAHLMLIEGDQGHPGTWMYIGVGDAQALYDELQQRGAIIRLQPTNYSWALETHAEDPDGNVLRFGSDPIPGRPFGPWKDMHGNEWG